MIDFDALFKITYGLFIVSSGNKNIGNGFISNTVFQVTSEPAQFALCSNKNNFTTDLLIKTGNFSVSVLHKDASPEIFSRFGYKSGKDINKFDGMQVSYGETGVPVVLNDSIAFLECEVNQTIDVGTHFIFIGKLMQSQILDNSKEPLTYLYYRQVRKGITPKNAPTYIDNSKVSETITGVKSKKFKCSVCGYVWDEAETGICFSDLPDDWVCPVCGTLKEEFMEL